MTTIQAPIETSRNAAVEFGMIEGAALLLSRWRLLVAGSLTVGLVAVGGTFLIKPTFTARTIFMPPQQQQSGALAAIGAFAGLANLATGGSSSALRNPVDQYVALMLTRPVADQLIERFHLLEVYEEEFRVEARKVLGERVRIAAGKKDGLISVEVDDHDPKRAAEMANAYLDELRKLTATLSVTEAQQRRAFFERQLGRTKDALTKAQLALEGSGFSAGALRAEPKAAAEGFARLRAETMAAEVRLQMLRGTLSEATPEVQREAAAVAALRKQLEVLRGATVERDAPDYISKYREFKYQETLFELFSRQYELARVDEAREGALFQVVEAAEPPEKKSRPKRAITGAIASVLAFLLLCGHVLALSRGSSNNDPRPYHKRWLSRWRKAQATASAPSASASSTFI